MAASSYKTPRHDKLHCVRDDNPKLVIARRAERTARQSIFKLKRIISEKFFENLAHVAI